MFPSKEQSDAYFMLMSRIPKIANNSSTGVWLFKNIMMLSFIVPIFLFLGNMYFPDNQWDVKNYTIAFSSIYFVVMCLGLLIGSIMYIGMLQYTSEWVNAKEKNMKGAPKDIKPVYWNSFFSKPIFLLMLCSAVSVGMNGYVAFAGWLIFVIVTCKIVMMMVKNAEIAILGQAIIDKRFKPKNFAFIE